MSRHEPASISLSADVSMYGATVLERVLLAIINAHPLPGTRGGQLQRLNAAMMALIGSGQPDDGIHADAVAQMLRLRQNDICAADMAALGGKQTAAVPSVRSNMELAKVVAREVLGLVNIDDIRVSAYHLSRMFVASHCQPVEPDYVQEALETEAVVRLCDELAEWDIPTRL